MPTPGAAHHTALNSQETVVGGVLQAGDLTPLTLTGGKVDIVVEHFVAKVTVTQECRHTGAAPTHALFSCPVRPEWTVMGWTVSHHGADTAAVATERASRLATYRGGALVAPIPGQVHPGDSVLTTFTYLTAVDAVGPPEEERFEVRVARDVLPDVREPRSEWKAHFKMAPQQLLPRNIQIEARVDPAHNRIEALTLPSHPSHPPAQRVDFHGNLKFSLPWPGAVSDVDQSALGRDVVLELQLGADPRPPAQQLMRLEIVAPKSAGVVPDEDHYALTVAVHATQQTLAAVAGESAPDFPSPARPNSDVVFLVDCTGSMDGAMAGVREAVAMAVQALPSSCMFNIITFGNGAVQSLSDASEAFNDDSLSRARDFVQKLQAGGPAELYPALRFAYTRKVRRGYARQVFLITDAIAPPSSAMGSLRDCAQLARDNAASTRVFAFGVGGHCDDALLQSVASLSRGAAHFERDAAELKYALLSTLEKALVPCLTDVEVSYSLESAQEHGDAAGSLSHIRCCYESLPLLFLGRRHSALALASSGLAPDTAVTLSGLVGDQRVSVTDHVGKLTADNKKLRLCDGKAADLLTHAAAARDRIRCLVEPEWEWKELKQKEGEARCIFGGPTALPARSEGEVLRLGKAFNLTTPLTILTTADGGAATEVAVEYQHSLPISRQDERRHRLQSRSTGGRSLRRGADGRAVDADFVQPRPPLPPQSTADFMAGVVSDVVASVADPAWPSLSQVLELQCADGRWEPTERIARCVGASLRQVQAAQPAAKGEPLVDYGAAWATALAAAFIARRFAEEKGLWRMMHRRAELYLSAAGCDAWIGDAGAFLQQ